MMSLRKSEIVFYACLCGFGLLATVYAMLNGTVRQGREPGALRFPIAGFNAPVIGAALMAFGAAGYLITKYSQLDTIPVLVISIIAAAAGWIGMTVVMARWAIRGPLNDPHEEIEELQGTVATVTRAISPDQPGEIAYSFRGSPTRINARSIDGGAVEAGTEVVIDRIENGVADVELWSVVEQRL
ncbi:MAG: NfeD family protein [Gemmatimonadota bacterium]|nr:NfeD family protein [Gemmatimonadota bacterium]